MSLVDWIFREIKDVMYCAKFKAHYSAMRYLYSWVIARIAFLGFKTTCLDLPRPSLWESSNLTPAGNTLVSLRKNPKEPLMGLDSMSPV